MKKCIVLFCLLLASPVYALDVDLDSNDATDVEYGGTNAATAAGARQNLKTGSETTNAKAANYTVGTDDSSECYGGVIYVTSPATITACDDLAPGMNFVVIVIGDIEVVMDVQDDNYMYLDGTAGLIGEAATNLSDSGDLIKCNYYNATYWYCTSGSLTSPGVWTLP